MFNAFNIGVYFSLTVVAAYMVIKDHREGKGMGFWSPKVLVMVLFLLSAISFTVPQIKAISLNMGKSWNINPIETAVLVAASCCLLPLVRPFKVVDCVLLTSPLWLHLMLLPFLTAETINDILSCYLLVYLIAFSVFYVIAVVQYSRKLKNEFSDLEHRDVWWSLVVFGLTHLSKVVYPLFENSSSYVPLYIYFSVNLLASFALLYYVGQFKPSAEVLEKEEELPAQKETSESDVDDWLGQKLKEKCEDGRMYLDPTLSMSVLCEAIGTNREYLRMYFMVHGTNYYDYINGLRIEEAVRLMQQNGGINISDLSERCGFSSESTLRRAVQKAKGISLSEYRK